MGLGLEPRGLTLDEIRGKLVSAFNGYSYNHKVTTPEEWAKQKPQGENNIWRVLFDFLQDKKISSTNDKLPLENFKSFLLLNNYQMDPNALSEVFSIIEKNAFDSMRVRLPVFSL